MSPFSFGRERREAGPSRPAEARRSEPAGAGSALSPDVRSTMEQRFGQDFSGVRVHTNARAAESASGLRARAYTLGSDIVFGAGEYTPATPRGHALLAHELAHVVQQESTRPASEQTPRVAEHSDPSERAADAAVAAVTSPYRSSALDIRSRLRATAPAAATVQRAVDTWGGEFKTPKYEALKIPGLDGVAIDLEFHPNDKVDAELIGMTQSVLTIKKGAPFLIGGPKEQAVFKQRAVADKVVGAGRRIDQAADTEHANPLYAAGLTGAKDRLATTKVEKGFGHYGWRFTDKGGKLHKREALLPDAPRLATEKVQASQTFETTAVAVKGTQEGTYYGSVSWGWERDAAGVVKRLPLTRVSKDVPSGAFTAAARKWATSKTIGGNKTIGLPIVSRGYARADNTSVVVDPAAAPAKEVGKISKNTRVEVTDHAPGAAFNRGRGLQWWKVTIVDGPHVGKTGWMDRTTIAHDPVP
jgi:hypothetical protein